MVSDGGAKRNWLHLTALGLAACLSLGAAPVQPPSQPQRAANAAQPQVKAQTDGKKGMTAYERESLAVDRAANDIGKRANSIADAQRIYGLIQLVLGIFGVLFTGIAAVAAIAAALYAKEAAAQARRSADADNANLAATQAGMEEARKDAIKQDKRFTDQLALSQETMEFTAKTSYAMEHSASAMRRMATATARAAEASNVSSEIARAIELPTLVLSKISLGDRLPKLADELQRSVVELKVRNYGRSPAFLIEQASEISLDPLPDTPVYNRTFPMDADKVAMPDKDHDLYVAAKRGGISAEEAEDIISGARILSVYGFVKYRDFLGNYTTMRFLKVARIVTLPRLRGEKMNALLPWPDNTIIIFNDDTDERRKKYSETTRHNAASPDGPRPLAS